MTNPRDHALAQIREALERDPALFVAMQYAGMLIPDALAPLRDDDRGMIERILSVPPAPEPERVIAVGGPIGQVREYRARPEPRRPRSRHEPSLLGADGGPGRVRQTREQQAMFREWVEGQRAWSPEVMGWGADDARAEGWADGRYDE